MSDAPDWAHIEWAAEVEKPWNYDTRDFEDYKTIAVLAVSQRDRIRQLEAERDAAYLRGLQDAANVAKGLNGWGSDCGKGGHAEHIAAAIRALAMKEQSNE